MKRARWCLNVQMVVYRKETLHLGNPNLLYGLCNPVWPLPWKGVLLLWKQAWKSHPHQKLSAYHCSQNIQKCKKPIDICVSTRATPTSFLYHLGFWSIFPWVHHYVSHFDSSDRQHWDQPHSVCLILYLVKTAMNRTPNSKMRSTWGINLIQWEAECGWRWDWSCKLEADRKDFVCFVLLPIYSTGAKEWSKSITGDLHSWCAREIILQGGKRDNSLEKMLIERDPVLMTF